MADVTRLSVIMSEETAAQLTLAVSDLGISYTETTRRAIALYDYIRRAVADDAQIIIRRGGSERELVLL